MNHYELRKKYLKFFISPSRNHQEAPSAPLVLENDPTTLFTSSGMQPLIPYLLGEKHPLGKRIVDIQKCFRAQDIDEVGDNSHTTFFEMLGNWSLGDYFKNEQLEWFFEFLTQEIKISPEKLYVTVFSGYDSIPQDNQSIDIWKKIFAKVNIEAKVGERIFVYPAEKNWWSRSGSPQQMPPGEPGGPDSEVFYQFTQVKHDPKYGEKCHPNCNCGRFLEIGNSVFMEYQKKEDGNFRKLPQQNVDFGGGLERFLAASNNEPDIFKIDLFSKIIETISQVTQKEYQKDENQPLLRIIADHLKAATFLIADGVVPANKAQGSVLRRLLRRAAIKLYQLQGTINQDGLLTICEAIINTYKETDYFTGKEEKIKTEVGGEILKFTKTLNKGLKEIDKINKINGKIAFDFYQTYGFPLEITTELFSQKGQKIDKNQFEAEFNKHRNLSRSSSRGMFKGGLIDQSEKTVNLHTATHLLQEALRQVLGKHVRQKGSHITPERLRFDFTHQEKLTIEQLQKTENLVNQKIKENLPVTMKILPLGEAFAQAALSVPGVKYPDKVKVYIINNFSKEICGGPHVDFTGKLGLFKIVKEEAASFGVRRIYAHLNNLDVPNRKNHQK